jgi:hypothetical protein
MGLFKNLFGGADGPGEEYAEYLTARINARLQPIDRGDMLEDPLDDFMREKNWGGVTGGGTQLSDDGGIAFCDLEIGVRQATDEVLAGICTHLETLGVPKGSRLLREGDDDNGDGRPFGVTEGFAFHFNNTEVPEEIQELHQVGSVFEAMQDTLGNTARLTGYWNGETETSVYFYGNSYAEIANLLAPILAENPRCQHGRTEQIA